MVEKAVRLAIESVMNVLCAVNSARTHELQRLLADREKDIQRLEGRVRDTEAELRLLLRPSPVSAVPVPVSVPEQRSAVEAEGSAEQRDQCEVRLSLALLSAPQSEDPPLELEQSSSSRTQSDLCSVQPECSSEGHLRAEPSCAEEETYVPPERRLKLERINPSPGRVKQEPVSPEHGPLHQNCVDSPAALLRRGTSEELSLRVQGVLGHSDPWPGVTSQTEDPAPISHVSPAVSWRSRRCVSRREESEEAMRRRRASWRAASRRYYARKMARLQIHSNLQNHGNHQAYNSAWHNGSVPNHPLHHSQTGPIPNHPLSTSLQHPGPSIQAQSPGVGAPFGSSSESWRFSVCDLAPLLQPPSSSTDVTFINDSDLLNDPLT